MGGCRSSVGFTSPSAVPVLLLLAMVPDACGQCSAGERWDGAECHACPDGKAGDGAAAGCVPCTAGTYASGAELCTPCPAGFVCPLAIPSVASGGTVKNQCPSGTASNGEGESSCYTCPPGKYAQSGSPYVPPVQEACVAFCSVGYTPGTADSPSESCPVGCTLTPAVHARDAELPTCTGIAVDDTYDCAVLFAAALGTAESDCNTGNGQGCTYIPGVEAADASDEACAATSTADCSAAFTPGDEASCPNEGVPTGCSYIAATDAVPAEPGASSCTNCPEGTTAAEEGTEICSNCDAGTYSLQVQATCTGTPTDPAISCETTFAEAVTSTETDCTSGDGAGCTYTPSRDATECLTCEAGYMCAGGVARSQCAMGTYSAAAASNCEDCPVGKRATLTDGGVWTCVECPPGQFTSSRGQAGCEQCPTAHRCPGGTQQRPCAGGTYQPNPGQADCINCPAGQMAESTDTACKVCQRGRYSRSASPTCKTCPGGYACVGNTDKEPCGVGKYSAGKYPVTHTPDDLSDDYTAEYENENVEGPTMCLECDAGMYTQEVAFRRAWQSFPEDWVCGVCDPGYECLRGSDKRLCAAGKYAPAGSQACIDCPPGQYSSEGAAVCITCDAGYYCPGKLLSQAWRCCPAGWSVTLACPAAARTYPTDQEGGTPGICTRELPGGTCGSGVITETCDGLGTGTCTSNCQRMSSLICVPGMFSGAGQDFCENCAPGRYSFAGNESCMPCTPGYFCTGGPVSEYAPRANDAAFSGASLQPSMYHANQQLAPPDAMTSRQRCPNGTWSNDERLMAMGGDVSVLAWCSNCSSGMFSGMGATSCTNCTAGKYSRSGWPECQNCSRATYCPGGTDEIQCPPGYFSGEGAAECTGCPPGKYAQPGAQLCSECDQGFWCPGATDRVACGGGTWMNGTGSTSSEACEPCGVPAACLPAGRCRTGHRGDFCLGCQVDPSPWYKVKDLCVPCPTNTTLIMAIAGSMFILFAIIMLRMGSAGKQRNKGTVGNKITVPFSILFTNLQIVMKFYELNLRWPQFLLDFVDDLETFLELDFVSLSMADPACSFQFENAGDGYRFRQNLVLLMLPAFCLCIALLHLMSSCAMSSLAMSGNRLQACCYLIRGVPSEVANACVTAFCTMFMGITASSLEVFFCTTRVKPELHMDQHPNIMCDFTIGSYPMIFSVGLLMLMVYVLGFPVLMFMTLYSRNKRWVPLDKENYVDPPNPFMACWRSSTRNFKTCCVKTLMSPILIMAWLFRDKESIQAVQDEEARLQAKKDYEEKMEMQLETRMKGGCHKTEPRVIGQVPSGGDFVCSESESECADESVDEPYLSLALTERIQGGKKAKKAAMKAAREAEAAYRQDSDEEKPMKKKVVKKKPKRTGPLNSYSFKDDSFRDSNSKPPEASVRSKSTRKLRSDLIGPTSALKAASFADLHHAKGVDAKRRRANVISTKSWLEQEAEGETVAAKSFKERQKSQSLKEAGIQRGARKSNLKSESFQKRMAKLKSNSLGNDGFSKGKFRDSQVVPESAAAKRTAKKLREATLTRGRCGRKPPEYDVDEMETDGYIYWHDGTRQTLGWIYLRFRPERWWFEFVFMGRKVAVLTVTTYLGNVGDGHVAWTAITVVTCMAFAAQWFLTPFPEDRATRYSKPLCFCCSTDSPCSPHRGLFKYPLRVLIAYTNPSLNDLELAGLMCQLVTLTCGLGCLIWGKDGAIDSANTVEQLIFVLGAISLCAILLFVLMVLIFWYKAVWRVIVAARFRGHSTTVSLSVGNAGIIVDENESTPATEGSDDDRPGIREEVHSRKATDDIELAGDEASAEQAGRQSVAKKLAGGSSKRGRKKSGK